MEPDNLNLENRVALLEARISFLREALISLDPNNQFTINVFARYAHDAWYYLQNDPAVPCPEYLDQAWKDPALKQYWTEWTQIFLFGIATATKKYIEMDDIYATQESYRGKS